MTLVELLIYGLATWRLSSLLVDEPGPFRIFVKLRELVGIKHNADDEPVMIPDGFLPGILSCIWCCSVWIGLFWMLVQFVPGMIFVASAFAFSSLAILISSRVRL